MIRSSAKGFFTSNLHFVGNWTLDFRATQNGGDVGIGALFLHTHTRLIEACDFAVNGHSGSAAMTA
jgi:hypothetical protein